MTHEKDIPEYALQPAKEPKIIPAEAIYHKEKITYPAEEQRMVYQFEEDILVPDIKVDMREILLIDGSAEVSPMEKRLTPKIDDTLNLTGTVAVQTLYSPEGAGREPVSINSKIPYKYQWNLSPAEPVQGRFSCHIKKLESMMINERKFRVKVSLEFIAQMVCEKEFSFFEGLRKEELQLKRAEKTLTGLGLTKRDEISIDEIFSPKDSGLCPETILKQDFAIAENYRQITTEKIVINGFVFASILFSAVALDGESRKPKICQHNQRIEFTHFVPIEKEHREKTWSAVRTGFTGKNLNVSIGYDEENPEGAHFHLTGDVDTQVELFESRQRDMVVDAYHREKNFACQSATARLFNLFDGATAEVSIREIITLPEGSKATEAVYGSGNISECQALPEKGRVVVTGMISAGALWKGQDEGFRTEKITTDFRSSVDMDGALPQQKVTVNPLIKTVSAELINDKQIELNASLLIGVETYSEEELTLIENPHFDEQSARQEYPMVIAVMKEGESLWDLAKRYRTTENHIRLANKLESEPKAGRRLLIVK